ncbi:S1/P1 nuclease [Ramlibacter sp. XY19]|uniref:S1/P1 nuclease n=1 Tax=Ramlibacter paludis TaxID=2908000 RepID=UPI0023DA228F|nr:S1/P1 nuclease [Ramlibacter paludis]MCG2595587.1 S1/P1 nuclease [Ramlibacter paludis]
MKQLRKTTLAAAGLLAAAQAGAWNAAGHRAVGTIADRLIAGTPAAIEVRKILGSNLRTAAVWADCAKGVSTTTFQYQGAGAFPECAIYENPASQKQMEAFVRRNHANCTSPHNTESCHKQYHYTDVAIQRSEYRAGYVGTSEQDLVAAINAALAVLQDRAPAPPFHIAGKREALRLLAHYVGDIHQPLHVAAVYVDRQGKVVDPDEGSFDPRSETHGGNDLLLQVVQGGVPKTIKMHGDWDNVHGAVPWDQPPAAVLKQARAVAKTTGDLSTWSTAWATESLRLGAKAYAGLQYAPESPAHQHATTLPAGYADEVRTPAQREQVVKAGARLAQLVRALWP